MPKATSAKPGKRPAGRAVHTIKVTLRGSKPPIWRRLQVPSDGTLARLHGVIQAAFGWEDYHMWAFEAAGEQYGLADRDLEIRSAAAKRLSQVAPGAGDKLSYTYDPSDKEHEDRLEWLGLSSAAEFDPDAFDLDQVNSRFSASR